LGGALSESRAAVCLNPAEAVNRFVTEGILTMLMPY
jgi:hypothetical protein